MFRKSANKFTLNIPVHFYFKTNNKQQYACEKMQTLLNTLYLIW